MRLVALAIDYDGTLACDGRVSAPTLQALTRFKAAGGKLLMVTGRELPDLRHVFGHLDLFDAVVAENGAVLFWPQSGEERALARSPPPALIDALRAAGARPLSVGRTVVATRAPFERAAREAISALGLHWRVILNKGAVMCLPAGVDKASGLAAALQRLGLSSMQVIGVGDAENDVDFLSRCGVSVAVADAQDLVKERADRVTVGGCGDGVAEVIAAWLKEPDGLVSGARAS